MHAEQPCACADGAPQAKVQQLRQRASQRGSGQRMAGPVAMHGAGQQPQGPGRAAEPQTAAQQRQRQMSVLVWEGSQARVLKQRLQQKIQLRNQQGTGASSASSLSGCWQRCWDSNPQVVAVAFCFLVSAALTAETLLRCDPTGKPLRPDEEAKVRERMAQFESKMKRESAARTVVVVACGSAGGLLLLLCCCRRCVLLLLLAWRGAPRSSLGRAQTCKTCTPGATSSSGSAFWPEFVPCRRGEVSCATDRCWSATKRLANTLSPLQQQHWCMALLGLECRSCDTLASAGC